MDTETIGNLGELRKPFPPECINQLPKGGTTLDYVGHAFVTERLLDVDPAWSWEPFALDANGLPLMEYDPQGKPVGLWIKLTVCGVTRPGYGTCESRKTESVKELIGDALRNAAMRFGVALDLWKKETHAPQQARGEHRQQAPAPQQWPSQNQQRPPQQQGGSLRNVPPMGQLLAYFTEKRFPGEAHPQAVLEILKREGIRGAVTADNLVQCQQALERHFINTTPNGWTPGQGVDRINEQYPEVDADAAFSEYEEAA